MIRCAFCDSAMMALEINGTNAHVAPSAALCLPAGTEIPIPSLLI